MLQTPISADRPALRARVWRVLETPTDPLGRMISALLVILILSNVAAVVFGSMDAVEARYGGALAAFEAVSVLVFSTEYAVRFWASAEAGPRWRWALTPLAICDLVAILPFFLGALFVVDLRHLRVLRLLRLAKLSRHFAALDVLGSALRAEARPMAAAMAIMAGLIVLAASLVYEAEHLAQPEAFGDIPSAMWWAAVTLTTVGYGDVSPVTPFGRLIAVVVMTCGVGMVALPAGMLASRFSEELAARRRAYAEAMGRQALDADEKQALRDTLGLSAEDAERVEHASSQRRAQAAAARAEGVACCPHCGKALDGAPAPSG